MHKMKYENICTISKDEYTFFKDTEMNKKYDFVKFVYF